jgi:hypothetical protein
LDSRILGAFSVTCNLTKKQEYITVAERAFEYFTEYFIDKELAFIDWGLQGQPT